MTKIVVAYIPVLHEGYWRFLDKHARERPLFVIGRDLHADYRPLAKDIRALDPELARSALEGWGIASSVSVLDRAGATGLMTEREKPSLILPAEDISYRIVDRHFPRCAVRYESIFLRWDKTKTVQMLDVGELTEVPVLPEDEAIADLVGAAEHEAAESIDWWRRVGAALRLSDGTVISAHNSHQPHELSPYVVGDPRSNFFKGVEADLSTVVHAEAALIAQAARDGQKTAGATMYVTDFPCPTCAKLIAAAGITRLRYRQGYAMLDGRDALTSAEVEFARLQSSSQLQLDGLE